MKVSFINPPFLPRFSRESRSPAVTKSDTLYYPKWLCHAAGYADKRGHKIDVIDAPAEEYSEQAVIDRVMSFGAGLIVCETSTPSINNDIKFVNNLRQRIGADTKIMLVGRHVSVLPQEIMEQNPSVDFVAIREYELTVAELADALDGGSVADFEKIQGMLFRLNGEIVNTGQRPTLDNLDELPFVTETYLRFLDTKKYFYGHSLWPLVVFDTSRGCPYKCSFCVYPQTFSGHKMRFRSVEHVADEFEFVQSELPHIKTVMFEDDTFIINKKRTERLADELIKRGNTLPFDSNCRVDVGVDLDFLKKLHKAGARLFCVGFESGNTDVVAHMIKNNNAKNNDSYVDTARQFAQYCKEAGIMVHGCFMFGNLNETRETLEDTLRFAKSLPIDTAQFYPIMIYPGTSAYEEAKRRGLMSSNNFSDWLTPSGLHNSVVNLPNLSHKDLVQFSDRARREFYLRPKYIGKKFAQSLTSYSEFKRNLKGASKLAKYLVVGSDV
jgi:anaerobic magnesium-protoporphyrin IX monomethyl ester cyclase